MLDLVAIAVARFVEEEIDPGRQLAWESLDRNHLIDHDLRLAASLLERSDHRDDAIDLHVGAVLRECLAEDHRLDRAVLVGHGRHRHLVAGPRDDRTHAIHDAGEDDRGTLGKIRETSGRRGAELRDGARQFVERVTAHEEPERLLLLGEPRELIPRLDLRQRQSRGRRCGAGGVVPATSEEHVLPRGPIGRERTPRLVRIGQRFEHRGSGVGIVDGIEGTGTDQ